VVLSLCGISLAFFSSVPAQTSAKAKPRTQVSPLWGDLEAGPFRVGFQVLFRMDPSRSYYPANATGANDAAVINGRPIRIMIWYPAATLDRESAGGLPMRFGDYVNIQTEDSRFIEFNQMLRRWDRQIASEQFSGPNAGALAEELMGTRVAAFRNAPPARGTFPIVLHSLGGNDLQQESTVLWEYLASYGYVVVTVPQLGFDTNKPHLSFALPDMRLQQRDLEFALTQVSNLPSAAARRIAVMGHSLGGPVAVLMAAHKKSVVAIVSLDGVLNSTDAIAILKAAKLNPTSVRAALLNMYRTNDYPSDFRLLDSLNQSDRYDLAFSKCSHYDFQNWPLYAVLTKTEDARGARIRDAATGQKIYLTVCRAVRHFLDMIVKKRSSSARWFRGNWRSGLAGNDFVTFHLRERVKTHD